MVLFLWHRYEVALVESGYPKKQQFLIYLCIGIIDFEHIVFLNFQALSMKHFSNYFN